MKKLKIEYININKIKPNEYNPKKMSEKEVKDLERSIVDFGIVDPLIINRAKERKGIIIGGHQRYNIYQKLGYKEVPIVWVDIPDLERERELCLRLSKNVGEWDWDGLANFDEEMLLNVGFTREELIEDFGINDIEDMIVSEDRIEVIMVMPPEAPRLKEKQIFYCDNSVLVIRK